MKIERGRTVITPEDHPKVVYDALLGSIAYYNATSPREDASRWCKVAQDSYETLHDRFGVSTDGQTEDWPNRGDATLYMSLDQLELALVYYGYTQIDTRNVQGDVEDINELLRSIDGLRRAIAA